jgi:hypothetical protein
MEGCVLSFLKVEWKVSDTGSAHWASSLYLQAALHVNQYNSIFLCLQAALRVNQYNVALRLLRKITDRPQLQILNDQQQNLFHVLALHTTPGLQSSLQLKVC